MGSSNASTAVDRVFADLGPNNPLRTLNDGDRTHLSSLLRVYGEGHGATKGNGAFEPFEAIFKLMADAAKLAEGLQSDLFEGPHAVVLNSLTAGFEDLPWRLNDLSIRVNEELVKLGKPGHQSKAYVKMLLIEASEFVRLHTGEYHDEHVAELLQAIAPGSSPQTPRDWSGDAIRKARKYGQDTYPDLYLEMIRKTNEWITRPSPVDSSKEVGSGESPHTAAPTTPVRLQSPR